MNHRTIVGAALLSTLALTGCSPETSPATGSRGSGDEYDPDCVVPLERSRLDLLEGSNCDAKYPDTSATPATVDGTFEIVSGGFRVIGATTTVEMLHPAPAIPTGTFVRMTHRCIPNSHGFAGAFVMLENLATLDGLPNPTEPGTRLWSFVIGGDEIDAPETLPFSVEKQHACTGDLSLNLYADLNAISVKGEGGTTMVAPGDFQTLIESSGPAAGTYLVKNVAVMTVRSKDSGGERRRATNFSIDRSD